jgi:stage IV sporulation protein FB
VFLVEPQKTPWDLNFTLFGFPVRVHPLFWLFGLLIGGTGDSQIMLIGLLVRFVSILIHELGHAFLMRHYGRDAYIVLYLLGGLAIEGNPTSYASSWSPRRGRTPWEQIYISFAGPAAQLLLAAFIVLFVKGMGGSVGADFLFNFVPVLYIEPGLRMSRELYILLSLALWFNTWWAVINLLPILPLDGGRIAEQLFVMQDPYRGIAKCIQLSIVAAIGMAIFSVSTQDMYGLFFFGTLAYSSYMLYAQIHGRGGGMW